MHEYGNDDIPDEHKNLIEPSPPFRRAWQRKCHSRQITFSFIIQVRHEKVIASFQA